MRETGEHELYYSRFGAVGLDLDPGWTLEFWQDRWEEHVRRAAGRFRPPAVDRERARAAVLSVKDRPPEPLW